MRHPRARAWVAAAGISAGGAALAGLRTATGRPLRSPPTLAAAGGIGSRRVHGLRVALAPVVALRPRLLARPHAGEWSP